MPTATAELVLDRRIIWSANNKKEVEQAKREILGFKRQGYLIERNDGSIMENFRPYYEEVIIRAKKVGGHVMKILCQAGDERLTWDCENGREAKQAKKKFQDLITNGHKAYSVDVEGKKNRRIHEFDVDAEEILMVPPTAKG